MKISFLKIDNVYDILVILLFNKEKDLVCSCMLQLETRVLRVKKTQNTFILDQPPNLPICNPAVRNFRENGEF